MNIMTYEVLDLKNTFNYTLIPRFSLTNIEQVLILSTMTLAVIQYLPKTRQLPFDNSWTPPLSRNQHAASLFRHFTIS